MSSYTTKLIDKAAEMCGSRYALAKFTEINESNLAQARAGRRGLSFMQVVKIAVLVKENPSDAWMNISVEKLTGKDGEEIRALLH